MAEQPIRLATLERVSSYSAVSTWWSAVSEYYSSAKNSENQTLASSVVLVERLATPAIRGLSRVPEYCPEGIVETVDGVAVKQLEAAESLVARGSETVSNSKTYLISTKDAAIARTTEVYNNSTQYVVSTKDAVVTRGNEVYTGTTSYAKDTAAYCVAEGNNYVSTTRDYAAETVAPYTSRVEEWRKALRERFGAPQKEGEESAAPQEASSSEKLSPFDRVAAVFPGIVRFDGDVILMPIKTAFDGAKERRESIRLMFQQRSEFARQMFQQAQETGENQVRATREYIQPAIAQPSKTFSLLKETTQLYADRALTSQQTLLETIRESVSSLEKTRGTNPESTLLRQIDYVPNFVFAWTNKTIDFSEGILSWTQTYVAVPKVVEVEAVSE